jgi:hypothetical protein
LHLGGLSHIYRELHSVSVRGAIMLALFVCYSFVTVRATRVLITTKFSLPPRVIYVAHLMVFW